MKILIVKTSAIGDVTHTMPALNAMRHKYPNAHITWLIEEASADVIKNHKSIDRVLVSKRKTWIKNFKKGHFLKTLKEIIKFIKQLRDTEYDLVIDFQSLLKSGILIWLTKGKIKAGFGRGMEHSEHSYIFLNKRLPAVDMNIHAVNRELILIKGLGIDTKEIIFDFPINEDNIKQADKLLAENGIDANDKIIAINPMAKWETKLWDKRKFSIIADRLIEKGYKIYFTGSKEDYSYINEIQKLMRNSSLNFAGKTNLKSLAALYKKSDLVVTTDTGPMHIAAAIQTPVVAIFGPTAPWRTGPFGDIHHVIRVDTHCNPCFKRQCHNPMCMKKISEDMVLEGISKVLKL